jgi:molybdate transport system substrate-binding protein
MVRFWVSFICAIYGLVACDKMTDASDARIAVATNFKPVMDVLEARFEAETEHEIDIVTGSTGALYAQITQGAPYDVFLSADQLRPQKLEEGGHAVEGMRFTYALGQLALWHPENAPINLQRLIDPKLRRLAIANPELAPYGRAAHDVLKALGFEEMLQDKLVYGENIGQTFAFIRTGNAEIGFVALSQLLELPEAARGAWLLIDGQLHAPIRQEAQLLQRGADNQAAIAFLDFLRSRAATDIISTLGYDVL